MLTEKKAENRVKTPSRFFQEPCTIFSAAATVVFFDYLSSK